MNAQIGPDGGAILRRSVEALGIGVHTGSRTTAVLGADKVTGVRLRDRPDIDCDMVVVAAGIRPNVDLAVTQRASRWSAPSWWTTSCGGRRGRHLCGGRVRPAPRRGLRPGGAAVGAGHGPRQPHDRRRHYGGLPRLADRHQAQGRRRRGGVHGPQARSGTPTNTSSSPSPAAASTSPSSSGTTRWSGATLLGDIRKVAFLTQAFDSGLPLPEERVSLMFDLGGPAVEAAWPSSTTTPRSATATASARARSWPRVQGRLHDRRRRDGRDPGGQGLRLVQAAGRAGAWSGPPAARWRRTRPRSWYVPGHPAGQADADGGHPRAGPALGVLGVRRAGTRRRGGREIQDGAGLAAGDDVGATSTSTSATPGSSTTACTPTSSATARSPWCRR